MTIEDKLAKQDAKIDMNDETKELPVICIHKTGVHKAKEYDEHLKTICDSCPGFAEYFMFGHWYKCDEYRTK